MSSNERGRLQGKIAIVTGAGSSGPGVGTGKAISVLLAREGATVALVDKFEERARETLDLIEQKGGQGFILTADLADPVSARQIVTQTMARCGAVDVLINNAAIPASFGIIDTKYEQYAEIMAINLTAPFLLCQAVIPVMVERGGGTVVNIVSVAAMRGRPGNGCAAYAASKGGLIGMTADLASAFGPKGIRFNCVAPGIVRTPMQNTAMLQNGLDPAQVDLSKSTALGIEGDAWDVARAAVFLAGPDSRFITGLLMPVDGGVTSRMG